MQQLPKGIIAHYLSPVNRVLPRNSCSNTQMHVDVGRLTRVRTNKTQQRKKDLSSNCICFFHK